MSNSQNIPKFYKSQIDSFVKRASELYQIRDEQAKMVNLTLNPAQILFDKVLNEELDRNEKAYGVRKAKIMTLKGRQEGITTYTGAKFFDLMRFKEQMVCLVLAHEEKTTPVIYQKYSRIYDNLPEQIVIIDDDTKEESTFQLKPKAESYSGFGLTFADETKSSVYVRTAGSGDSVGKGDTLSLFHGSEVANWIHYKDVMESVNQQLPDNGFHISILESTANGITGMGEGFYKDWTINSQNWNDYKSGKVTYFHGYRPVFIPWFLMEKYRMPLENGKLFSIDNINFNGSDELKQQYLDKEQHLVEVEFAHDQLRGLEHINWYRYVTVSKCSSDILTAYRYYPFFPEDAFYATTQSFFNSTKLYPIRDRYEKEGHGMKRGYINEDLEFVESDTGELLIKELPDDAYENRYIVSVDQSTGMAEDYASLSVFDRLKKNFVAKLRTKINEPEIAVQADRLGQFYNMALLIPESNMTTVVNILNPEFGIMPYPGQLYFRSTNGGLKYGFQTMQNTKKDLILKYSEWLKNDNYDKLLDYDTVDEHINFIKKKNKAGFTQYMAADGHNDDQVISNALCIEADEWWEEPVVKLTEDRTDISKIYEVKTMNIKGARLADLGRR